MAGFEAEGFVFDEFFLEAGGVGEDVGTAQVVGVIIQRAVEPMEGLLVTAATR